MILTISFILSGKFLVSEYHANSLTKTFIYTYNVQKSEKNLQDCWNPTESWMWPN